MDENKNKAKLEKLVGKRIAGLIFKESSAVTDAANDAGLRQKEAQPVPAVTPEAAPAANSAATPPAAPVVAGADRKIGDLTVKEFGEALGATLKEALAPALGERSKQVDALRAEVTDGLEALTEGLAERLDATDGKLNTLLGEAPNKVKSRGFSASNGGPIVTAKDAADAMPAGDAGNMQPAGNFGAITDLVAALESKR